MQDFTFSQKQLVIGIASTFYFSCTFYAHAILAVDDF